MLKKLLKVAFAAICVTGLATSASAEMEVNVGGKAIGYFGQYNSGVDGNDAWFEALTEGQLQLKAKNGPISVYYELEVRESGDTTAGLASADYDKESTIKASKTRVDYTNNALVVSIGTITPSSTVLWYERLWKGGTSELPHSTNFLYGGYTENDGIMATYEVMPKLKVIAAIHDRAAITLSSGAAAGPPAQNSGQTVTIGVNGMISNIGINLNSVTETLDDHQGGDTTTNSAMAAGVKLSFGTIDLGLDYTSLKQDFGVDDINSTIGVSVAAAQIGPGDIGFTYEMLGHTLDGDNVEDTNTMWLIYDVSLEKGVGVKALYSSRTKTPEGGDSTTSSYIGAGLYANF